MTSSVTLPGWASAASTGWGSAYISATVSGGNIQQVVWSWAMVLFSRSTAQRCTAGAASGTPGTAPTGGASAGTGGAAGVVVIGGWDGIAAGGVVAVTESLPPAPSPGIPEAESHPARSAA